MRREHTDVPSGKVSWQSRTDQTSAKNVAWSSTAAQQRPQYHAPTVNRPSIQMGQRRRADKDGAGQAVRTPMECSADVHSVAPLALIGCSIATKPRELLRARPWTSHQRGPSAGRAGWCGRDDRLGSDSLPVWAQRPGGRQPFPSRCPGLEKPIVFRASDTNVFNCG